MGEERTFTFVSRSFFEISLYNIMAYPLGETSYWPAHLYLQRQWQ